MEDSDTKTFASPPEGDSSRIQLPPGASPAATWAAVATQTRTWAAARRLALRDVIVLLPFVHLLAPARQAFAAGGGWQPRIETTQTLADSLAPGPLAQGPGQDAAADRLVATQWLRRMAWGSAWEQRDRRGFQLAVAQLADAAAALALGAASVAPGQRAAWWQEARRLSAPSDGPGALEQGLLRLAVEWAGSADAPATDRLFALQPAAWVLVQAGGADSMGTALARDASEATPTLWLESDADVADPYAAVLQAPPQLTVCDDFEDEALAAASALIEALNEGLQPVALVTQDRELTRRVRALLERDAVPLADETGWALSTTRAAARLMAWLRAAAPTAGADDTLLWFKGWPQAIARPATMRVLERRWRRQPGGAGPSLAHPGEDGDADLAALWQDARQALAALAAGGVRSLADWCQALAQSLRQADEWGPMAADAAGAQVLASLRLAQADGDSAWPALAAATRLDLVGFTQWVDTELEAARFVPPPAAAACVVLTPLSRAVLRPFAAVVMPGADARHLGADTAPAGLISDAVAEALGLPTVASRRLRERLALAQLLRSPRLSLLRRRLDGEEPLAASPEWQWLQLRRLQAGAAALAETRFAAAVVDLAPAPVPRPLPIAAGALPASLSASQVEALRACPYRFFGRAVLRLSEADELEREAEKRDYGSWLHAVLHRFHAQRADHSDRDTSDGSDAIDEAAALAQAARTELEASGFDADDMLPFLASFEHFSPVYLAWLAQHEAQGWFWHDGELALRATPAELAPTGLHGRLDRIDRQGAQRFLIDYKTGSASGLKNHMKPLLEDTQLAFYAALLQASGDGSDPAAAEIQAAYLTLDDADAPQLLVHVGVADSAQALLQGLGGELQRLRDGAAMPALGEGQSCDFCELRGLCRRDHWAAP